VAETLPSAASTAGDGRHDFDWLVGRWRISNRRLSSALVADAEWQTFEASNEVRPILSGLGNVETYLAPEFPGRPGFEGFGLRLFDPATGTWRIWWASTAGAGQLDPPVEGRFDGDHGRFECDDAIGGKPVRVRFDWTVLSRDTARWEQSFSFDGGASFAPNWEMEWTRAAAS
jgi:hypothetical protein